MLRKTADDLVACLSAVALLVPTMPAMASTLTDLEGVRASAAESTIQARGYHAYHSSPGGGGRYTYWWNNSTKSCVRTLTSDGVIAGTKTVSRADCGYHGSGSNSDGKSGSGNDAAVAVAVAAAAIIGVAALSHKSHHRNDKEYPEPQGYADFERGHRDGLYNHPNDTYSRSDAYSDGYRSGVDEREQQSNYRSNPYAGSYRGGNYRGGNYRGGNYGGGGSDAVDVSDLVGSRAAGAQTDLQSRGFRSVDSFQSGNGVGTVWWNGRTRQCLQMITADGRADSITDVQTHPRCR